MTQRILRNSAIAVSTLACAVLFSVTWSERDGVSASVESAQARVGRPLTPVSVAGVGRRQARRAAYGYGYGAGAVGTAAAVTAGAVAAAASPAYGWGSNNWTDSYAAQTDSQFGQPFYPHRAYYGNGPYYGYSGWSDYQARNGLKCEPGTLTKLDDGQMYRCQ